MFTTASRRPMGTLATRAALACLLLGVCLALPGDAAHAAGKLRVPEQYPSIQAAVDAARPGDVIDIAPGVYPENVTVDVAVTLRGREYSAGAPRKNSTVIDGGGDVVVTIPVGISPAPELIGLVITDGIDGVSIRSPARVTHTYFVRNGDSLDVELGGGGVFLHNVFDQASDDAIDIDHPVIDVRVVDNRLSRSADDGIEMRLHDDVIASTVRASFLGNQIVGSGEDGIQIIDYFGVTDRRILIDGNLIRDSQMAAIGLMSGGKTLEDYRAANVKEPIFVLANTLVGNDYGISGGDALVAVNNIFEGHVVALNGVDGGSVASHNLYWGNEVDAVHSTVVDATSVFADPRLSARFRLLAGSPAIDAGAAWFEWNGEVVVDESPAVYQGNAPDLGWWERQ